MKFLPPVFALFTRALSLAPLLEFNASHPLPAVAHGHFHSQSLFKSQDVPRLVVYVQTFTTKDNRPLSLLPLLENHTRVTHVILASVHLHETPGEIRLNDDPFDARNFEEMWKEIKTLQDAGIKVSILLGGAAAGTYKNLNGTDDEFYAFYHPLLTLIKKYNLDGLDIDVEEPVSLSVPLRLLNALYRDLGSSFLLTMAPIASALLSEDATNLSGFSYFALDALATVPGSDRKLIKWFNAMFYGHFPKGPPHYEDVIEAGWNPERVVMGVLDSADGGQPNGFLRVERLGEMVGELRGLYEEQGGFGGVAGWEYFDAGSGDGYDGEVVENWQWVKRVGEVLFGGFGMRSEL
ncbi:glycoside hydrolase family 18 protein [Stipitochalara longipes BDJ]|nr:glycoside hydrolase family 18 protein [Stipitochalara longipes BDJ]